ncbi:MAG: DUF1176 domain-containing protein [Duganella sp.]
MRVSPWMAPALLALVVNSATAAGAPGHFVFRDWEVACDNTRRCQAVGYQADSGNKAPAALRLTREAGVSQVSGRLMVETEDDASPGKLTLLLDVDGFKPLSVSAEGDLPSDQLARLLPHMLNANIMVLRNQHTSWDISLDGIKAALLKMDDVQGRVGTNTALARRGDKPASAVPPPLAPPVVQLLPPVATRKEDAQLLPRIVKTLKNSGCEEAPDLHGEQYNDIYRLSASEVLLVIECNRGAYQSSFELVVARDRPPYAAKPVALPDPSGKHQGQLLNPSWEDGMLHSSAKGRGLGDCFAFASWGWTARGFQLTEASSSQLCRGMPGGVAVREYTATVRK